MEFIVEHENNSPDNKHIQRILQRINKTTQRILFFAKRFINGVTFNTNIECLINSVQDH